MLLNMTANKQIAVICSIFAELGCNVDRVAKVIARQEQQAAMLDANFKINLNFGKPLVALFAYGCCLKRCFQPSSASSAVSKDPFVIILHQLYVIVENPALKRRSHIHQSTKMVHRLLSVNAKRHDQ